MENNNGVMKGMLIALLVLYVVSPLDLCPGPVDDFLLILLSLATRMKSNNGSRVLPYPSADEDRLE